MIENLKKKIEECFYLNEEFKVIRDKIANKAIECNINDKKFILEKKYQYFTKPFEHALEGNMSAGNILFTVECDQDILENIFNDKESFEESHYSNFFKKYYYEFYSLGIQIRFSKTPIYGTNPVEFYPGKLQVYLKDTNNC